MKYFQLWNNFSFSFSSSWRKCRSFSSYFS